MNRAVKAVITGSITVLGVGASSTAGPLAPPAGPITSTYKTLTEVEPRIELNATNTPGNSSCVFLINKSGSYYLTGNMTVPSGKNGIQIYGTGVTIDLNGFTITGSPGSLSGITTNKVYWSDITVKNGAVEYCGVDGIDFSTVWSSHITSVAVGENAGAGISVLDGIVDHCTAYSNQDGFASPNGFGLFQQCTASNNTNNGFTSGGGSAFESCTSNYNASQGFNIGSESTVRNCTANGNSAQGIVCVENCLITGNLVAENGGGNSAGIWLQGDANTAEDNTIIVNGYGIYVSGTSNFIIKNRVGDSSASNFYIVPGNHVGLITTPNSNGALINGNSGGGLGTTDPNANFVN
jgi:parallel beta-helix repeat protein